MRSGTTSLARYLDAHPDVFLAPTKEVRFFDRHHERGLDWYRSHFAGAGQHPLVGEATQTYLYDHDAMQRMAAAVPDARLVAILRDPVDRAYSHYWLNKARDREPLSFEDALAAEPERLARGDLDSRFFYSYVDRGRYVHQIDRLERLYPPGRVHLILFDDLRDRAPDTYAGVLRFLGARPFTPDNLGRAVNTYTSFRSVRLRRLARRLPGRARDAVGRINAQRESYPPLDPGLRAQVAACFADDNAALAERLARDLSLWSRPA
ncbi:MAG: hypothetical protein QOE35_1787 [Actinomycetota bacterium]